MAGVRVTKDRADAVMALVDGLDQERVLVGIPSDKAWRKPEEGEEASPVNNAVIGYIQEFGSPARNIPARPFLVPGVRMALERIGKLYESAARALLSGRLATIMDAHHRAGMIAQASVRRKITDGPFQPLSPVTLAKRRARGVKRTKPLIDTGQLRNSINYVVRPRESVEVDNGRD